MSAVVPEDDMLAAELALGVLEGAERAAAEARAVRDPAFAVEVAGWEERLAPMLQAVPAADPPPGAWSVIEAGLGGDPPADLVARRIRRQRNLWRGYGVGMSGVAAALLVFALARPAPVVPPPSGPAIATRPAPMMSATLAGTDGKPMLVISYQQGARALLVSPVAMPAKRGHSHELWLIVDGQAPVAIGVMAGPAGSHSMAMPQGVAMPRGATPTLAVSIEPVGGSPTGAPTGPVVAKGTLTPV